MTHVLDNPVWNALTGRQSHIATGSSTVRRYLPDISPWAAVLDDTPDAMAELAALIPAEEQVIVLRNAGRPFATAPNLAATHFEGVQMVARTVTAHKPSDEIVGLGDADAPEMIALAALTKPGPFIARTHSLGDFIGIRKNGQLVAMAGERFKIDGYTEVSGVCTHPDWRGRGYAGLLSRVVATRIAARGETPILHAFATNTAAIRLYEQLGFEIRAVLNGAIVRRA